MYKIWEKSCIKLKFLLTRIKVQSKIVAPDSLVRAMNPSNIPETKFVHSNGKVSRLVVAVIQVAVVHRDQVHVAEDEAVVLCVLQSLCVADVQQLGTVESVFTQLQEKAQEKL